MRIGFVTGEYPPMQGGVGAFTCEVAKAMSGMGHRVHVFTRALVRVLDSSNLDEQTIDISAVVGNKWGWNTIHEIHAWTAVNQIDIVNVQFQTAAYDMHPAVHWLPVRLDAVPVVVTFHDLRVPYLFPKAGPVREWIIKKLAYDANGVIATDRTDVARLHNEWYVPHVCWIPIGSNVNTTPPADYNRQAWREAMGVAPDDLVISYFGFLNESKGGLILIEALARLINQGVRTRLVMIGGRAGASDPTNVEYGKQVDALIEQHGLEDCITWTGFIDDPQVSAYFYASDLSALPYLDGVSLRRGTLMAALAHGRAIVTTYPQTLAPELEQVVETVPPNDADALAEAIMRVWNDLSHRRGLEQAAKQAAERFSWDEIARQTIEFFDNVLCRWTT